MVRIRRFAVLRTATTLAVIYAILAARFTGGIGVEVRSDAPAVVALPPPAAAPSIQG